MGYAGTMRYMARPTDKIPNSNAFAGFMGSITSKFGVADAETQQSADELLSDLLKEHSVTAKVHPLKWGKIVIEAPDAPSAQSVNYMMTAIEDALREKGITATVQVRVARR